MYGTYKGVAMLQANLTIAPNGRVVIPANMRAKLGWQSGGKLLARLVDGTVVLEPIDVAIHRAQAMVRQYVPQGSGLVEELIAERHEAAERE
jgi:AbrB family looped-hinge helix DNA binding protein